MYVSNYVLLSQQCRCVQSIYMVVKLAQLILLLRLTVSVLTYEGGIYIPNLMIIFLLKVAEEPCVSETVKSVTFLSKRLSSSF